MRKGSYSEELVRIVVAMNTKEIEAPTAMLEASRGRITTVSVAGLRCTVFSNIASEKKLQEVAWDPTTKSRRVSLRSL